MRYAAGGGNFIADRLCAAVMGDARALHTALAAKGRERRGRFAALAAAAVAIAAR